MNKGIDKNSVFKPGEICRTSGQYAVVNRDGNPIGTERTVVRGRPFPPTSESGQQYLLVDPTQLDTSEALPTSESGQQYLLVDPTQLDTSEALPTSESGQQHLLVDLTQLNASETLPREESLRLDIQKAIIPGILAVYLNISLLLWGWVLLDVSTGTLNIINWLGFVLPDNQEYISLLKLAFYAAIGGAIGGIVFGMQNLWKHATKPNSDFKIVFAGDYLFRQFGAATLAVVIFALVRGGILTALGTDPSTATTTTASTFSSFSIGFLSGFGSYQVINKLDELIKKAFGKLSDTSDPVKQNEITKNTQEK